MAGDDAPPPSGAGPQSDASFRYAVVDLAIAEALRRDITGLRPPVGETLFDQGMDPRVLMVAPWLVRLSQAPGVEAKLAEIGADLPWGYYVHSTVDISSLRRALRRFNLARLPGDSRAVLFRYWDPRVMRVFLDIASKPQHELLFEWIDRIDSPDGSFSAVHPRAA